MKTKLTEMFGIEYPIVQSGMQWLAVPQLAAAVCNAGGIGTINVTCWPTVPRSQPASGAVAIPPPCSRCCPGCWSSPLW